MKWLKVYKTFRGGRSKDDYIRLPDVMDADDIKEAAENWAERAPGGENYGWTVHWEPVDKPPIEWIDKKIEGLERRIEAIDSNIRTMENEKVEILEKIRLKEEKINLTITEKNKIVADIMDFMRKEY
jgi:hypothetical protein